MPRMGRTIKISDEVHKSLVEIGGKAETFDDVIKRLVEFYREQSKK
jgi:predicted CopG family antitoxin